MPIELTLMKVRPDWLSVALFWARIRSNSKSGKNLYDMILNSEYAISATA
jgi:hypothetical protein